MSSVLEIPITSVLPLQRAVLRAQGVPNGSATPRMENLANRAIVLLGELARPLGEMLSCSREEFSGIYAGEGNNEAVTPIDAIYPRAEQLSLFAVTLGEPVSERISRLFDAGDFAMGAMLDAAASEAADQAAQYLESHLVKLLRSSRKLAPSSGVLRFSPGYCGWHISGQKKLFTALEPGEIGICLTDSFLMTPLKSVSGVIIVGHKSIFEFDDTFPFCVECKTHSCRERMNEIME
ncbi:MAG TPA: vitamin B12 dependent-methionine synthase activation domain-containing protein [Candidatus Acidoferrum sp.]|nr:vitamin B12 dependent-methionine synthase activation domain-containing protein [Candidatus Acidoferrum sp.]